MCLTLRSKTDKSFAAVKADKDIVCYKIVRLSMLLDKSFEILSGLYFSAYVYGRNNVCPLFKKEVTGVKDRFFRNYFTADVEHGFHSYVDLATAEQELEFWKDTIVSTKQCISKFILCEAVIPEGTYYYTGLDSESRMTYASERLVIKSVKDIETGYYKLPLIINYRKLSDDISLYCVKQ